MSNINLKLLHDVDFGESIHDMKISPDGKFAAVCRGNTKVSIVDIYTGVISEAISFEVRPTALSFSKDGFYLYVVLEADSIVEVFTDRWTESRRIEWESKPWDVKVVAGEDRRHVYAASNGRFDKIDFENGEVVNSLPILNGNSAFALLDNKIAYISGPEALLALDLKRWKVSVVLESDYLAYAKVVTVDSARSRVYVGRDVNGNGVSAVDLNTNNIVVRISDIYHIQDVAIDSTGSLAFVVDGGPRLMFVYDVASEVEKVLEIDVGRAGQVAITNNDKYICIREGSRFKVFELLWERV
ncbi:YncE family protein [Pseudomonas sp. GT1P32]